MNDANDANAAAEDGERGPEATSPDDAFAALGNETRLRAIETLSAAGEPPTFTELFEASDADSTAGFAYHLRQLTGRYVRKTDDDRYVLTYAGRQVARALAAGTYTERVDREPEPVAGACPVCGAAALESRIADNYVAVGCAACATELLSLPFPPAGARARDPATALEAFDAYHRARLRLLADGVCPDCAGRASGEIAFVAAASLPGEDRRPVLEGSCADCDFRVRAPVSVAVAGHPDVAAFFRAHEESVRDRPLWNLGPEWGETVLSEEPPAVRVSVGLGGEALRLLVGDGPTVVDVERGPVGGSDAGGNSGTARDSDAGGDDGTDEDRESERDRGASEDYDAAAAGSS